MARKNTMATVSFENGRFVRRGSQTVKKAWLVFGAVFVIFWTVMYFRGYESGDDNHHDMVLMNNALRVVHYGFEPSETALREIGSEEMENAVELEQVNISKYHDQSLCDVKTYNCAAVYFHVRQIKAVLMVSFNKRDDDIEDIRLNDSAQMLFSNRFGDVPTLVYRDQVHELDKYADK